MPTAWSAVAKKRQFPLAPGPPESGSSVGTNLEPTHVQKMPATADGDRTSRTGPTPRPRRTRSRRRATTARWGGDCGRRARYPSLRQVARGLAPFIVGTGHLGPNFGSHECALGGTRNFRRTSQGQGGRRRHCPRCPRRHDRLQARHRVQHGLVLVFRDGPRQELGPGPTRGGVPKGMPPPAVSRAPIVRRTSQRLLPDAPRHPV